LRSTEDGKLSPKFLQFSTGCAPIHPQTAQELAVAALATPFHPTLWRRTLLDSLIEGFMEDKAIIERQQKTLAADPSFQMLAILADAPLAHFRRVLGKLLDAEQVGAASQSVPPRVTTTATG